MRRRASAVLASLMALALLAAPTSAIAAPALTIEPSTADAGTAVTATGTGFDAGSSLQLYLDEIARRTFLGEADADRRGAFTEVVTISATTTPGEHTVLACEPEPSGVCRVRATAKVTVRAPASTPPPTGTPTTTAPPVKSPPPTTTVVPSPGVIASPPSTAGPSLGATIPDLSVTGIEVTQGVQNLANHMPLLPLRSTFARAYIHSAGGTWKDVRGVLGAFDGGSLLGTVSAINQPLEATDGLHRKDTISSLIFRIPAGWTTRGQIELIAFAYGGTIDAVFDQEPNADNNFRSVTVTFGPKAILYRAVLVPVHIHEGYSADTEDVSWIPQKYPITTAKILSGAERLLPVSMILPILVPFEMYPPGHLQGNEFNLHETSLRRDPAREKVLGELQSWKEQAGPILGSYQWYGMLPDTGTTWEWNQDIGKGISFSGQSNADVSMGKMSPFGADVAFEYGTAGTLAHEWGHDLGLSHYACVASTDPAYQTTEQAGGSIDPKFPTGYPNCSFAVVDPEGYYGFDVHYDRFLDEYEFKGVVPPAVIGNDPAFAKGQRGFPLMSYAGDKWLDPYSACTMLNALDVMCTAYPLKSPGPGGPPEFKGLGRGDVRLVAAQSVTGRTLMVSGSATTSGASGELLDVAVLDDVSPSVRERSRDRLAKAPATSRVVLSLQDAAGTELARHPLAAGGPAQHEGPEDDFAFVEWIPAPDGLRRVVLLGGGTALSSVTATAGAPSVEITSPADGAAPSPGAYELIWRWHDPDGDALSADLLASSDGGKTWQVIASGVRETSFTVPVARLAGGAKTRFRVRASDGFHTARDETGNLRAPNSPPNLVLIMSPAEGDTFRASDLVVLNGRATDLADEMVENLSWSSDRDGALGAGAELQLRSLTPGRHVITLRATDLQGASSEQRVSITIDGSRVADVPDAATLARARDLLVARIGNGDVGWQRIALAAGVVVALIVSGLWARAAGRRKTV